MNNFIKALGLIVLVFNFCFNGYSQEINFTETPSWVKTKALPTNSEVNKYDVNNGVYTTLYDLQQNLNTNTEFLHLGLNVLSYGGVKNASEIYITFDSSYQTVDFHYLNIWRNGVKQDRTKELTFETLNNETNLQAGIYSGKITAYDILEDIRKGDIIEYAYSIVGQNPIFDGNQYNIFSLATNNPIDEIFIRLIADQNLDVNFKCSDCESYQIKEEVVDNNKETIITSKNIKTLKFEESASSSQMQYAFANLSTFTSWKAVELWAMKVFSLEKEQNLDETEKEIYTPQMTKPEKIDAIINFVQDEIRYMGIESGIGSHQPFSPEQVVKQRFGDCKDKSLLAAELLKRIGVEKAYPVLVASYMKNGLDQFLPGGQVFDHCILYFKYEGKPYWVDPTIALQGGTFKTMVTPDYGSALIIGKQKFGLTRMNLKDSTTHTIVSEFIDASSFTEPATIKVTTDFYGLKADNMRSMLEYYSKQEVEDFYKQEYAKLFPKIVTNNPLQIKDDEIKNVFTITESYLVEGLWKNEKNEFIEKNSFQYEPMPMYSYVNNLECEEKKFKVAVPEPSWLDVNTEIIYPESLNVEKESKSYTNAGFTFNKTIELKNENTIVGNYSYRVLTDEIDASEYPKLCDQMNELVNDLPFQIYFSKFSYDKKSKKKKKSKRSTQELDTDDSDYEKEMKALTDNFLKESVVNLENLSNPIEGAETFTVVDKMPIFPGGNDSLMVYFANNVVYPNYERKNKIEGTVYASYIIDQYGKAVEAKIIRSVKGSVNFDDEVLRVINSLPIHEPGEQNGKKVRVQYTVPIKFNL